MPAEGQPALEIVEVRRGAFGTHSAGDTSGFGGLIRPVVLPPAAERPFGGVFDVIADELVAGLAAVGADFGSAVEKVVVAHGELTFVVRREHLLTFMSVLRDEPGLRFELCLGVSGVHWPGDAGAEFHAVYPLLSITHNRRVRVETTCPDADSHLPSIVAVYPTNDWHERETYDFFGIIFDGHPSLTRIEMPDDWAGHPQRKDYPLGGIPVEYKGATVPPADERRSYS
jgi:NADH-quinone oxidoreductase subunit C